MIVSAPTEQQKQKRAIWHLLIYTLWAPDKKPLNRDGRKSRCDAASKPSLQRPPSLCPRGGHEAPWALGAAHEGSVLLKDYSPQGQETQGLAGSPLCHTILRTVLPSSILVVLPSRNPTGKPHKPILDRTRCAQVCMGHWLAAGPG